MVFSGWYPNGFIKMPYSGVENNFTIWPWHVGDAYYECYFTENSITIAESDDGVTMSLRGGVFGVVERINCFGVRY